MRHSKKSHKKRKHQRGGNPALLTALPTVLGAVNTIAKTVKPATRILDKWPNARKIPIIGALLDGAKQFGYGSSGFGTFNNPNGDSSNYQLEKNRRLPLFPNGGLRSGTVSSYSGSYGTGSVKLTNY